MNHRKAYILQKPISSLSELSMLGIERIVKYFAKCNQPKEIEIPPEAIIFDYNPDLVHLTKDRMREMVPPEIRKVYEELTGVSLAEEPPNIQGQLPEGVEIIQFKPNEVYENFKKSNYQKYK